jgi:hypothetical protein
MFFDKEYVSFKSSEEAVKVANPFGVLPIVVDENEHKRVHRVVKDLQTDIEKVTHKKPMILHELPSHSALIVATAENSIVKALNIDVSEIEGKWESYLIETIQDVETGEDQIVIVGSDSRGAIFGVYDFTEKIGVSPWYWWMDVPVQEHEEIYVKKGRYIQGEPSVQYRGFFLNDEGPSLMNWVRTHFPDFTHEFYEKIFELTLRLKGNYHWPAMWDSTFYEDDPLNIVKADEYGVVIGTSHHEPMDRPHGDWKAHKKGPWDYQKNEEYLRQFWKEGIERSKNYETIPNLGMRGDGDMPMGGDLTFKEKIALMEKIISDQREIIQEVMGPEVSIEDVPQMWALYKEVKEYYDAGMDVPEDVTLLWGDDNWGNIRRLPTKEERKRKGGAGIYYHFDYVGGPRSYKWVNTVPLQKTWEQMHKAYEYDARKVWIVNVGDLKPMEFQTEFFLKLAWNVDAFSKDNLWDYSIEWAEYTFGEKYGKRVAQVIRDYVKYNGRLKPELINDVTLYSWDNEFEAERILAKFEQTVQLAEQLLEELPDKLKDAFYQVAYYPARASYVVLKLQLMCDLSKKLAQKGLPAANIAATEAEWLFEEDKALTLDYNKRFSNGKWDHMMDQLHIGYTYWNQPEELVMPEVRRVPEELFVDGEWVTEVINGSKTDVYSKRPLIIDIYNKGIEPVSLLVVTDNDFLKISRKAYEIKVQARIKVLVDWDKVPYGEKLEATITLQDDKGKQQIIPITIHHPEEKIQKGFIPIDGKIAIEAEDFSRKKETEYHQWEVIPDYGRTKSSVAIYPVELVEEYSLEKAPALEYDFYQEEDGKIEVNALIAPSLAFDPERDVRLGISIDGGEVQVVSPGDLSQNGEQDSAIWEDSVKYNIHSLSTQFNEVAKGLHTLKVTLIDPQVVLQKIVIQSGVEKPTYLGPMPTPNAEKLDSYLPYQPEFKEDYTVIPGYIPYIQKATLVHVQKAGWYQFVSEEKTVELETIDGLNALFDVNEGKQTYYLSAGTHIVHVVEEAVGIEAILLKESFVDIRPTFRIQETKTEKNEWLVQIGIQNRNSSAQEFSLIGEINHLPFVVADRFGTKGVLKKEEQELHTFTFLNENIIDAVVLNVKVIVDGWERTELFEFSF